MGKGEYLIMTLLLQMIALTIITMSQIGYAETRANYTDLPQVAAPFINE